MTRGAIPLTGSPSKKRYRTIEPSDASSSNEPISPNRYADTESRPIKRVCNLEAEKRRTSAPSEMVRSPLKDFFSTDMLETNHPTATMKQEPVVCSPQLDTIASADSNRALNGCEMV